MSTIWKKHQELIKSLKCDWCDSNEELYSYDGDVVCRECLSDTEIEEEETYE